MKTTKGKKKLKLNIPRTIVFVLFIYIVFYTCYGLYNQKDYTQKEIADKLNISQSYISRIEKKVIKRIKYLLKI